MTPSISYRSPLGRVIAFGGYDSRVTERHEPGPEADAAWERWGRDGVSRYDGAEWVDGPESEGAPNEPGSGIQEPSETPSESPNETGDVR